MDDVSAISAQSALGVNILIEVDVDVEIVLLWTRVGLLFGGGLTKALNSKPE